MMKMNPSIFHLAIVVTVLEIRIQLADENELVIDRSKMGLTHVPKNLSLKTTVLGLSHNHLSDLQTSDILSLSKLRILILSYNRIQHLDTSVFRFNQKLEYLDVSHNKLWKISCHPTINFKHLDLSFNEFDVLPICKEFQNMSQLDFLGLSATRLQRSSMLPIAQLSISEVLLVLGDLYGQKEDPESLQDLNTKSLHIIFPKQKQFHFVLDIAASSAVSVELSNIKSLPADNEHSHFQNTLLKLKKNKKLLNLTLNNVETTWSAFIDILQLVWQTTIEYFSISNVKLTSQLHHNNFNYSATSLKALSIRHVFSNAFQFRQELVYQIISNMKIQAITVTDTRMMHLLCPLQVSPLVYLNFSNNLLTDALFKNCKSLIALETLILRMNKLKGLANIAHMTKDMKSLTQLDVSQNSLRYEDEGNCSWTESLLILNMSSNVLTGSVFRCLPPRLTVLDIHSNRIESIPKEVTSLKALGELNIAFNFLTDLPGCGTFSSLSVLIIDHNSLSQPSSDFFSSCHMRSIRAGNNPFHCSCELREFIKNVGQLSSDEVKDWPASYQCAYPDSYEGTTLKDFHMPPLSCNTTLLIVTIGVTLLVLVVTVTSLCIYLDLPWYLRMICQWTQTRHRAKNIPLQELQSNFEFHAFVSYSGHDSVWVKKELLPNLEKEGIRICLHERNFVPGKSIVENIINFIDRSYKSIFVLSPNFIQSEWCHYELYFAHHKHFHGAFDNLILLLLEPIPQYSIPSNYHKLKSLMAQRTYIEWPKEKNKHALFWANLRAAINVKLTEQKKEIICK
ncbi:toll-like receptor 1 [Rhynchocyon petersi]